MIDVSDFQQRLAAVRYGIAYPYALKELQRMVPELTLTEPDWRQVAERMFGRPWPAPWNSPRAEVLRGDEGDRDEHRVRLQELATNDSQWVVSLSVPAIPALSSSAGTHRALVMVSGSQLRQLIPALLQVRAPGVDVRSWSRSDEVLMHFDALDPCCDGACGHFVQIHHPGSAPA